MVRLVIKHLVKIVTILSPFLVGYVVHFSFVDHIASILGVDAKHTEDAVKTILSTTAGFAVFGVELVTVYEPKKHLEEFAQAYFIDVVVDYLGKTLAAQSVPLAIEDDIRINIMFCRRRWLKPWRRTFVWFANAGFETTGRDQKMTLHDDQGIAGRALLGSGAAEFGRFPKKQDEAMGLKDWWSKVRFRSQTNLRYEQYRMTSGVRAVLSVPIKRNRETKEEAKKANPTYVHVGVINVDALTVKGAKWLEELRDDPAQTVIGALSDYGSLLALIAPTHAWVKRAKS